MPNVYNIIKDPRTMASRFSNYQDSVVLGEPKIAVAIYDNHPLLQRYEI